ncbi:mucin-15 [Fundulus heteroclitus]|uniref:mucin-15 n=1 Tax=Fundulus heteroclitus TaxID=8078 RepID=UPI00165CC6EA|nr:mucin-15 [Fundulus heteroclitus]
MKPLKITATLILLLQAFHLVYLQDSTDSPGRTLDKSWLRQFGIQSETVFGGESDSDQGADQAAESSSGTASGFMTEEDNNTATQDESVNGTFDDSNVFTTIIPSSFEYETTKEPELPDAAISQRNLTTESNSSQTNMTYTKEDFNSSMTADNTTSVGDFSNNPDTQITTTTVQPTTPTTATPTTATPTTTTPTTTTAEQDKGMRNLTENTTTSPPTTEAPETFWTTTVSLTTTVPPSETTGTSPITTTTGIVNVPDSANKTGKVASGSERGSVADSGSETDPYRRKRNVAWLAVLGTAAATAVVGLVAYIILKKKHQKPFTHRKLEEYPADPVLRLDNSEPLDLNYAYYNPTLQGDSIQMSNIPGRR